MKADTPHLVHSDYYVLRLVNGRLKELDVATTTPRTVRTRLKYTDLEYEDSGRRRQMSETASVMAGAVARMVWCRGRLTRPRVRFESAMLNVYNKENKKRRMYVRKGRAEVA